MSTENEFKMAWCVAKGRLSEFPNITFVIETYVAELREQNQRMLWGLPPIPQDPIEEVKEDV